MENLAEAIHSATCRYNHTDQCAWFYQTWEKPGWDRARYLESAKKLVELTRMLPDQLALVMSALREATR
jgi:hypothetical protein